MTKIKKIGALVIMGTMLLGIQAAAAARLRSWKPSHGICRNQPAIYPIRTMLKEKQIRFSMKSLALILSSNFSTLLRGKIKST